MTVAISADRRLEQRLCEYLGKAHCVLTGRGSTAIYLALRAMPVKSGSVVLPDILCPAAANAVVYASFTPLFCDVSLDDYTLAPESFAALLEKHSDVAAVVAVHTFGHPAAMDEITAIARKKNVFVIEDAAQALGGEYKGKKLGSMGDVSILSFGYSKIISIGWGGAVVTDDAALAQRMREELEKLPSIPANIDEKLAEYRTAYYSSKRQMEADPLLKDIHLFKPVEGQADLILTALDTLDTNVRNRRAAALKYRAALNGPGFTHPTVREGAVPWRYTFLVKGAGQKQLTKNLRTAGMDASNWYPPLHPWYASAQSQNASALKNSLFIGEHVINLWTDASVSDSSIERTCDILLGAL